MKHLKMFGLAAVAAAAMMAFVGVGTAAAGPTELFVNHVTAGATDNTGGVTIHATLASGTSAVLSDTSGELADTCKGSTVHGVTHNTTAERVTGDIEALTWENCNWSTETLNEGDLSVTYVGDVNGDGVNDGTVFGTGSEVEVEVFGFIPCLYGTEEGTHLGTLTGSTEGHAKMDINAMINKLGGSGFCPETTRWVASYTVTTPTGLTVGQ